MVRGYVETHLQFLWTSYYWYQIFSDRHRMATQNLARLSLVGLACIIDVTVTNVTYIITPTASYYTRSILHFEGIMRLMNVIYTRSIGFQLSCMMSHASSGNG